MTIAKMTSGRMELDGVALDLGHEEVVLDLLDQRVEDSAAIAGSMPAVAASSTAGIAEMIGPMIGNELEDAGDDRQQDGVAPEDGSTMTLRICRPMNVTRRRRAPRISWPRSHWPKTRSDQPRHRSRVGAARSAGRIVGGRVSAGRSLIR